MDTFVRLNGYALNITDEEAYNLVMEVVQGQMSKSELAGYLEGAIA
jgi:death-on-curing protein